jgi:ArsR family transcriptional regulator
MTQQKLLLTTEEERLAAMFKALGNPTRMRIMRYLVENPQCITGDIVQVVPQSQATVSQHLKVLRDAGLIQGTIEGPATSYCVHEGNLAWLRDKVGELF